MSLCNYTEFFPTCETKNLLAIIKGITTSSLKLISYTSMPTHSLILIMWVEPFNNFLFYFFNLYFHLSVGALSVGSSVHHMNVALAKAGGVLWILKNWISKQPWVAIWLLVIKARALHYWGLSPTQPWYYIPWVRKARLYGDGTSTGPFWFLVQNNFVWY